MPAHGGEEPLTEFNDDVSPVEMRRRIQDAIRQLRLIDADLAIMEARERHNESLATVARRLGHVQGQIEVVRRKA